MGKIYDHHWQATEVPIFPYESLPSTLREVLDERSSTPKDDAIGASLLEAVSSLASSGLAVYEKPEGGTAPLNSFGILLASSGAGKSFHHGPLTEAISQWCTKASEQIPATQHQQQAAHRVWRKRVMKIEKDIQQCLADGEATDEIEALLAKTLGQEPLPAVTPALLQEDASMQAVLRDLEHWPVSGWIVDEGMVALNMLRSKDFPTLANLFGGKIVRHSRVGESRKEIKGYLTTLFMVQPGLFKTFYKKRGQELKAGGLDARFLYHIVADNWIGSENPEKVKIGGAHKEYNRRVTDMLDDLLRRIRSGQRETPSIAFSRRAKEELQALQRKNIDSMAKSRYSYYRDLLAKQAGHIARMAAKNHIFLGLEGEVSLELVELAERICDYHFDVYMFTHDPLDQEPQRVRDAAALERFIRHGNSRHFRYDEIGKLALKLGMTTTNLRGAIGELFNQNRAVLKKRDREYLIELIPPPDSLDNIINLRQF